MMEDIDCQHDIEYVRLYFKSGGFRMMRGWHFWCEEANRKGMSFRDYILKVMNVESYDGNIADVEIKYSMRHEVKNRINRDVGGGNSLRLKGNCNRCGQVIDKGTWSGVGKPQKTAKCPQCGKRVTLYFDPMG